MLGTGQALNFGLSDLYPGSGFVTTRDLTIPEAADQNTMVDDQKLADQATAKQDPSATRNILIAFGVLGLLIVLTSWK